MNYGFKPTTHGEALIAACMDLGAPLKITRAAVGSGLAGGALANTHALVHYITDASIGERRHEGNQLFLSVQYRNDAHPEIEDFVLSEFIVYAQNPETGQDTDLLYATLGDSRQPVPSFRSGFPASVWTFPIVLTVSGDLRVDITASPGLVTSLDLQEAIDRLKLELMTNTLTFPLAAASGEELLTSSGTPILAVYHPNQLPAALAAVAALENRMEAGDAAVRAYADNAGRKAAAQANAYTAGKVLDLTGGIAAAKAEAITAASTDAAAKAATAKAEAVSAAGTAADAKIAAHNDASSSHPLFLRAAENTGLAAPDPGGVFQNGDLDGPQTIPDP